MKVEDFKAIHRILVARGHSELAMRLETFIKIYARSAMAVNAVLRTAVRNINEENANTQSVPTQMPPRVRQTVREQLKESMRRAGDNIFYQGDKLICINNLDEDGDRVTKYLNVNDICVMLDRCSEGRGFIIVLTPSGKEYQLETRRFKLHERASK